MLVNSIEFGSGPRVFAEIEVASSGEWSYVGLQPYCMGPTCNSYFLFSHNFSTWTGLGPPTYLTLRGVEIILNLLIFLLFCHVTDALV